MRELIIQRIKESIDRLNKSYSWDSGYVPKEYPNFDSKTDEEIVDIFDRIYRGPVG